MKILAKICLGIFFCLLPLRVALTQDLSLIGGDLTSDLPGRFSVQLPAPNISSEERFNYHLSGFEKFHGSHRLEELNGLPVLGPFFNHDSCGGCHVQNGKGRVAFGKGGIGSPMLIKISLPGLNDDGSARGIPNFGGQLQDHSLSGKDRFDINLDWKEIEGTYRDGRKYKLRKPLLSFKIPGFSQSEQNKLLHSLRMSPPMIGLGLLEAVPAATIEAMSDPNDLDADGISGRVNYVPNIRKATYEIGRFGFKASHPTIEQQTAGAFFNDMGMTSELFPIPGQQEEVPTDVFERLVFYLQAAGIPRARDQDNQEVIVGKGLFTQIGCADCHKFTLHTEDSAVIEVSNQEFHPFTDLLLHDMGAALSDQRPEYSASGREWRTTPLWGIGVVRDFGGIKPAYLHDGRARKLDEAILWHGGEAKRASSKFKKLTHGQRRILLKFIRSL